MNDGPLVEWWEAGADGRRIGSLQGLPPEVPHALVPGALMLLDGLGVGMLVDMQNWRESSAGRWRVSLTVTKLPDPLPQGQEFAALRREMLRVFGWIA